MSLKNFLEWQMSINLIKMNCSIASQGLFDGKIVSLAEVMQNCEKSLIFKDRYLCCSVYSSSLSYAEIIMTGERKKLFHFDFHSK